jgi:hypothetical protein
MRTWPGNLPGSAIERNAGARMRGTRPLFQRIVFDAMLERLLSMPSTLKALIAKYHVAGVRFSMTVLVTPGLASSSSLSRREVEVP